jgi:large subunit ribosomal protein L29
MKMQEITQLALRELKEKSAVLEEELFNLRFQAKMGQLSNPVRLRIVRRDIARVKTLMGDKAREAASSPVPAKAASPAPVKASVKTPKKTPAKAPEKAPSKAGKTKQR